MRQVPIIVPVVKAVTYDEFVGYLKDIIVGFDSNLAGPLFAQEHGGFERSGPEVVESIRYF